MGGSAKVVGAFAFGDVFFVIKTVDALAGEVFDPLLKGAVFFDFDDLVIFGLHQEDVDAAIPHEIFE